MTVAPLVLAHAGPGSTWQAMVVVAGVALTGVVLAAGIGWLQVRRPADLVAPLAATAVLASLGVLGHEVVSDGIGWGLPLAVVSLGTLLLGGVAGVELRFPAAVPMGALALLGVSAWLLYAPLTVALHPPPEILPLSDDAELEILAPREGAEVAAGVVPVTVTVVGGSIGPGGVELSALPEDPEEAGELTIALQQLRDDDGAAPQRRLDIEVVGCTVATPCEEVTVEIAVPAGTWQVTVDLNRGDGTPLAPPVRARASFTAVDGG
ncbi:MAG: hypothetical protein EA340_13145 [Nitriliruptor sp.]|nr:MAG: hypothetical protein EA340_13145 [Nitriliruptor sp.]